MANREVAARGDDFARVEKFPSSSWLQFLQLELNTSPLLEHCL